MADTQTDDEVQEIAASLNRRAVALWGEERAEAILPMIEETAQSIWRVSKDLTPVDE